MAHYLVFGASRGIGQAIAKRLLDDGNTVTVAARSREPLKELSDAYNVAEQKCFVSEVDLSPALDIEEYLDSVEESAGPLDGVVHAAGVQLRKPAIEVSRDEIEGILNIHLVTPYLVSASVARRQIAGKRGGSHVFIGSLGSTIAIPNASPYTAAKSGVRGVVNSLAVELADKGIRVNAVNPGYVHTELTAPLLKDDSQMTRIVGRTPVGRLGEPSEIASVVAFLLGEDASFVTGEMINADGGWLSN